MVTEPLAHVLRNLAASVPGTGGQLITEHAEITSNIERLCNVAFTGSPK